eukprot:CAMPEP_0182437294 /NCGR_PEP_ID=MMETSP1167-20130531/84948_1 /TAXON_ID=2988 /ORGANISM="Mallomonas Sp, Strain CCMP3275" /LENGTH=763 /DNA_ID=CAMNT_0024630159 /DNA_START=332 /DNA_END=2624 /DNA_ORIENTATION=-
MFSQYEVPTCQLLVTCFDFDNDERRNNIKGVIEDLLAHGIVPVINENDAVSANQGFKLFGSNDTFSDNDSLAAIISGLLQAKLMVLLTDVAGVFDKPPSEPDAKLIDIFDESTSFLAGEKSRVGRGGMGAKVGAVLRAIESGVEAALIAPGGEYDVMDRIMKGDPVGTLFLRALRKLDSRSETPPAPPTNEEVVQTAAANAAAAQTAKIEDMAKGARSGGRQLLALDSAGRERILEAIATALDERQTEIIAANELDLAAAKAANLSGPVLHRLKLTSEKIKALVEGIRSIAAQPEPIGQTTSRTLVGEGLTLEKITAPIGVLLIIFESRPDCLPQIAALAIRSGNGLLLKGGKEAEKTNAFLHGIVTEAIQTASGGAVDGAAIGLVTSRSAITSLLKLDEYIDLVIPRGSNALVKHIKDNTKIPVMGHSDGVCHLYVDKDADPGKAIPIAIDGKTDYPSGNGLLLKGGKEAEKTNTFLHGIIAEAIQTGSDGAVDGAAIGLVRSRSAIASLLKLDAYIDLVIPRGSNALVKHIKDNTKIPVMGHSDGVCHLYVDKDADPGKAIPIAIDGKTDYPSACNAIETILLHRSTLDSGLATDMIAALRNAGVTIRGGDKIIASGVLGPEFLRVQSFRTEYGDLTVSMEVVDNMEGAVDHINTYGSSHTDVIVTEDKEAAELFLKTVDSACVYHNASSRFSDGFRFGLGAEVGISTGRIHARGPVGVEGLLTSKWQLRSTVSDGHTASMFSTTTPEALRKKFLHVKMAV